MRAKTRAIKHVEAPEGEVFRMTVVNYGEIFECSDLTPLLRAAANHIANLGTAGDSITFMFDRGPIR